MNTLFQSLDPSIAYALGYTIIHSFWQASLIALLMSLVHRFGRFRSATFKYGVSVIAMAVVFIISAITFFTYYSTNSVQGGNLTHIDMAHIAISSQYDPVQIGGINAFFAENLTQINLIWGVGVLLFLARFIFSYLYTKYLRNTALYSNTTELEQLLEKIKSKLLFDKVISIAESSKIKVPLVLGHFKPLILFPIGMVNMLSTAEVEAIITHELAHIKRFDYLTNILLTVIEILFYYHPAVWWISANVKAERENCCDDFALSQDIDKVMYAKALVKLEEIKSNGTPALAMPFSSKKHQLLNRIERIMNMPQTQNDIKEKSIATVLLLSIFLLFNTQANSESSIPDANSNIEIASDTLKLEGNDEMVLTVKDGKFESLEVDNVLQQGAMIDKIASSLNSNSTDNKSYSLTMKDSPVLKLANNKIKIVGQGAAIYQSDDDDIAANRIQDTIPSKWEENSSTIFKKDDKIIEIEKQNGEISKLKIDGKVIPKNEYKNYKNEIESLKDIYNFDTKDNIFKEFDGNNFSESFGLLFDGEKWREFGGNIEQLLDSNVFRKLEDMEHMRFDFKGFDGLERLKELEGLGNQEEFKKLEKLFEEMGIKLDTALNGMNFQFHNFDGLNDFEFFNDFKFEDDGLNIFREDNTSNKNGTVVERIGDMLNRDGLLKEYKANRVEITGKHLKINGEKMPKALFEKYKNIYQESTGAPLTKNSKMVFEVEGKPSKRKVKTF